KSCRYKKRIVFSFQSLINTIFNKVSFTRIKVFIKRIAFIIGFFNVRFIVFKFI
ncbi:hypothetical protein TUBRATIS_18200, partial [Tubulinosema ratisbonensis]